MPLMSIKGGTTVLNKYHNTTAIYETKTVVNQYRIQMFIHVNTTRNINSSNQYTPVIDKCCKSIKVTVTLI